MDLRYTRHQVARGARPDAVIDGNLVLAKFPSTLRATYQIRVLLFMAVQRNLKLILRVRKDTKLSAALAKLVKDHAKTVKVERVG